MSHYWPSSSIGLERDTTDVEVEGSSPSWVTIYTALAKLSEAVVSKTTIGGFDSHSPCHLNQIKHTSCLTLKLTLRQTSE